jgi:hypothetical protein
MLPGDGRQVVSRGYAQWHGGLINSKYINVLRVNRLQLHAYNPNPFEESRFWKLRLLSTRSAVAILVERVPSTRCFSLLQFFSKEKLFFQRRETLETDGAS